MSFYNMVETDDSAELYVEGEIVSEETWGFAGTTGYDKFRLQLQALNGKDLTVKINSPGGDVFAGAGMYSLLKEYEGKVTVKVLGIAASAASVIAMAGDEILMSPVSYLMIHDPWTVVVGNARDMEKQASVLREVSEGLISAYQHKTGKDRDTIRELLEAETYMSAQTAVDEGFADGILYQEPEEDDGEEKEEEKEAHMTGSKRAMVQTRNVRAAIVARLQGDAPGCERDAEPDKTTIEDEAAKKAELELERDRALASISLTLMGID